MNKVYYLPEVILERDKEQRERRSQSATQAMSDAVVAKKRPGPSGSPIFGSLRFATLKNDSVCIVFLNATHSSVMCHRGHTALVAPCTEPKSESPNVNLIHLQPLNIPLWSV